MSPVCEVASPHDCLPNEVAGCVVDASAQATSRCVLEVLPEKVWLEGECPVGLTEGEDGPVGLMGWTAIEVARLEVEGPVVGRQKAKVGW